MLFHHAVLHRKDLGASGYYHPGLLAVSHSGRLFHRSLEAADFVYLKNHGLASFIVHPDTLSNAKRARMHAQLLEYLKELESSQDCGLLVPRRSIPGGDREMR